MAFDFDNFTTALRRHPIIYGFLAIYLSYRIWPSKQRRSSRELALQYASKGARLCLVGRRETKLVQLAEECRSLCQSNPMAKAAMGDGDDRVLVETADVTVVDDIISLRTKILEAWRGFDTLVVCAGVGTLKPCLELAGVESSSDGTSLHRVENAGIEHVVEIANRALGPNYLGPLIAAVTFIPLLTSTSASPSIMLMSTLAAVIPAPTASLYCASKSASLLLYQTLAIENPAVAFTCILPSTVRGQAFFDAAIDGGSLRPGAADPNQFGSTPEDVAKRSIEAVDRGEKLVLIPGRAYIARALYWIAPALVERFARKRYNYPPL
ncbi:hypothetical protein BN946_scf184836.g44 [Trametes cinnabarina]|uniref:NAD(P)-binding protein n=1 Tax=Pycnoporus cinnabarinus TaxID=5643 RepID=A0A060S6I3_PYCCI|nr:hypothetical protein BN946_scf184836.g44 [Trametes cinnabarina]